MSFLAVIQTAHAESLGLVGRASNKVYMGYLTMHSGPAFINSVKSASSQHSNFWRFNLADATSTVRFGGGPTTSAFGLNSALCSFSFRENLSQANVTGHHNAILSEC